MTYYAGWTTPEWNRLSATLALAHIDAAQTMALTASTKGLNLSSTTAINDVFSTVASATTPDIWTGIGNVVNYTGTATATGFVAAPQAGARRTLVCVANAPFTAGANVLIDGYASGSTYTAVAGDKVHVIAVTTTQFRLEPSYQDTSVDYLLSVSGTNTITATTQHTLPAYKVGQCFDGIAAATNTGATTLAISGLSAGAIQVGGVACSGGELIATTAFRVCVSSTTPTFELISSSKIVYGFLAQLVTTNQTSGSTVLFNQVNKQVGGTNYATGTGLFTAPVTGWYSFSASLLINNTTGSTTQGQITIGGGTGGLGWGGYSIADSTANYVGANAISYLTAGQTASVTSTTRAFSANFQIVAGSGIFQGIFVGA